MAWNDPEVQNAESTQNDQNDQNRNDDDHDDHDDQDDVQGSRMRGSPAIQNFGGGLQCPGVQKAESTQIDQKI